MKELLNWLETNNLEKYTEILIANDITNLELLSELTEVDIKELGFSLGDRKRFLIGIKNITDKTIISTTDHELLQKLPYVIAYPLQQTLLEQNAPQRLNYLRDTFLNYLKYLGLLTASEFFNSPFKDRKMVDLFLQKLAQPSFGSWNDFTRTCLSFLKTQNHTFFCPDLVKYYETVESGKKRKMYKGEIEVIDSYNGGETRYIEQEGTGIGMLINFRNRYLGHGLTLDSATAEKLWNEYFPIFRTLLEQLTFCEKYPMLKQEETDYYSLQGIEIKPFEITNTIDSNVSIYNRDTNSSMPIIPFFIIPGELAIEREEKANIMSYESNNGKTITFFSPEGITKQTSGKILERLNLLLRNKQKEIPFTPETFTKDVFAGQIAEENELMLKSLLNEKKVIEGIYQHREEMEIKLREWIGARANIFFIAAEAGSGKTNLLVEIQRQYAERNLLSLFVRASRMEKPSLKEELGYQLNIDTSLDVAHYSALAGTQAEPTFILIDGLNEAGDAEAIWNEILDISAAFEPGSLKFIITNRANSRKDLDRYVISKHQIQYLYGENKSQEEGLGAYAFWLTPLDMKEMKNAWESYIITDKNRFKPLFSFNDIASFDRGLYLQINNPLVLRIFLETYKGKKLPQKGTKYLHVWKDWFATFSNEEQKFMDLLADAVWGQGENELLLDTVLNTEKLRSYFLTDSISAPYHRLLNLGWISRYVKDLTVFVSFTVEGLLLYLLGTKLNKLKPTLTSDGVAEILNNGSKLQKAAIESLLCEQAIEGNINLIAQLIDKENKKLELCITPLLYYIKYHGADGMVGTLLSNPTENDWEAILLLINRLTDLELHVLKKEFLSNLLAFNPLNSKNSVLVALKTISIIERNLADHFIDKINTTSFLEEEDILSNLGSVHDKFGNYDKALECFEKCLDIRLKILGGKHPSVATSYNNIGYTWDSKGEYDKALEYYSKSLDIRLKTLGEEHPDVASSYNNIGSTWDSKGEYDKALEYHAKGLNISLKTLGEEHTDVATSYNNIGLIWKNKGEYDKALGYYTKSLNMLLKTLGEEHPNVATSYNNIGRIWKIIGEYDKALEYYTKSLNIRVKTLGEEHAQLVGSYINLGATWKSKGENDKALAYYLKCQEICVKTLGGDHPKSAIIYKHIAYIWDSKGEYDKALNYYTKCMETALKTLGEEHPNVATSYNKIAGIWTSKSEYDKALEYYGKCLEIEIKTLGLEHPEVANSYNNIGGILDSKGEYDKALEYYTKSLNIRLKTLGEEHPDVAKLYYDIGWCNSKLKRYGIAIDFFKKGLANTKKGGFPFQIAKCYEALEKKEIALEYNKQSSEIRKTDTGVTAEATHEAVTNARRLAKELGKEEELPEWMR
jgi:tetratricopeptide (TPR) repeat protein